MRAFVLRLAPVGLDLVPAALEVNEISIGWPLATDLLDPSLGYWQFREVLKRVYHANEPGYQRAGRNPPSCGSSSGR